MFIKSFISLTIIVIIATLNIADLAGAKPYSEGNKLTLESSISRMRRSIGLGPTADESDIPKGQLYTGSRLRFRRQTAPGESDVPKQLQKDFDLNRAKRQMPSPPGDMPMPPM